MLEKEHNPVNMGNPDEMTLLELAKIIVALTNTKSKIVYKSLPVDDPKVRCPDISKARRLLEWKPRVRLENGLAETVAWFKKL